MKSRTKRGNGAPGLSAAPTKGTGEENSNDAIVHRNGEGKSLLKRSTPVLVIAVGYVLLAVLLLPRVPSPQQDIVINHPSPVKLVAPWDFSVPNHERTLALRQQAAEQVTPVFDEDPLVAQKANASIDAFFGIAQAITENRTLSREERRQELAAKTQLSVEKDGETLDLLLEFPRYTLLQETVKRDLQEILQAGVVATESDSALVRKYQQQGIDIRDPQGGIARRLKVETISDLASARQRFRDLVAQQFSKSPEDLRPRQLAVALGDLFIQPNLTLNQALWQERQQVAMNQAPPVMVRIQRNQKILDQGDIVPAKLAVPSENGETVLVDTQLVLARLSQERQGLARGWLLARVALSLVPLLLWGLYIRRYQRPVWQDPTTLCCLVGILVVVVGIGQLFAYLGAALGSQAQYIGYAMPVALAGLLITILLNSELALFTILVLALYSGLLFGVFDLFAVHLTAGVVSVFSVSRLRRRIDISWAGVVIAFSALGMATLFYLGQVGSVQKIFDDPHPWILIVVWSFLHGILTTMIASLLLPVLESLMGVVTDIQLLELSQKNELLKELEVEAPGTYQHSLNVASLAESAADAIGANGLFARVASLYHDIGKLSKPAYFSENQTRDAEKKAHAKLTPSMSRLLICNHVKDGLELAEKHNLPEFIRDVITQHHGTTLLTYFYDKALQEDSKDVVSESDYRYPGPKPQSVEMAIIMLADSLEAASRSLPLGITQGDLYQFVRKIINEKFIDDQFDECDLTLSDLHRLAEAFTRNLVSLLHRRVPYPTVPSSPEKQEKQAFIKPRIQPAEVEQPRTAVGVGSAG